MSEPNVQSEQEALTDAEIDACLLGSLELGSARFVYAFARRVEAKVRTARARTPIPAQAGEREALPAATEWVRLRTQATNKAGNGYVMSDLHDAFMAGAALASRAAAQAPAEPTHTQADVDALCALAVAGYRKGLELQGKDALIELVAADDAHKAWCDEQKQKPWAPDPLAAVGSLGLAVKEDPVREAIIARLNHAWEGARRALAGQASTQAPAEPNATMSALLRAICSKWSGYQKIEVGEIVDFIHSFPFAAPAPVGVPASHPLQPLVRADGWKSYDGGLFWRHPAPNAEPPNIGTPSITVEVKS